MDAHTLTPDMVGSLGGRGLERMEPFCSQRKAAFDSLTGRHYGKQKAPAVVGRNSGGCTPVNLTAQQVRTLLTSLAYTAGNPEVDAMFGDLEFEAKLVETWAEMEHRRLRVDDITQYAIVDAILSGVHIRKIGLRANDMIYQSEDETIDNGQTFDEPVDLDDYFTDPDARREAEIRIEGHRYRCRKSKLLTESLMGREPGEDGQQEINPYVATPEEAAGIIQGLTPINSRGRSAQSGQVAQISNSSQAMSTSEDDTIELWDAIWYGDGGKAYIFTFAAEPNTKGSSMKVVGNKFLNCFRWDGYDIGPLEKLWFIPVPNNIMPLGLEQLQRDLALVADALANKLIAQMLRAKSLPIAKAGYADLGIQAAKAPDGKMLQGDPKNVGVIEFRAMLDQLVPGMEWVMNQWNNTTGNLQLASGQGGVGDTATEFAGLAGRVAGWLQFLQAKVESFSTRCLKRRAHYFISDPLVNQVIPYQTPVGTMRVPYDASMRSGAFEDYTFRIRSFPADSADPAIRMKRMVDVFSVVIPAVLQLAMSGVIDAQKGLRMVAEKFDMPELENILMDPTAMMQAQAMQMLGPSPGGPPPSQKVAAGKQQEATTMQGVARGAAVPGSEFT